MNREILMSYIGKGEVNHNGYIIEVTSDYMKINKIHYLEIELKPINEHTNSAFFTSFLEYIEDDDLEKLENSFKKAHERMKEQELLNNRQPLKLARINNLSSNYLASFEDQNNNKYVLMETATKESVELCTFYIEPDIPIKVPIEINGQTIKPKYSFWLNMGIYNKEEFMQVLENEKIEDIEEEEVQ